MDDLDSITARHNKAKENGWLAREIVREPLEKKGVLEGQDFFAKDLYGIENEITRSGSAIFDEDTAQPADAALVRNSRKAGARLIGATNMDALAYGFVTNNPLYGLARNPVDPERICGGSSGGSAAVVAAGLASFALGTDTSGSIRIPSAFCGVAGYKPSSGVLDQSGVVALSPTFDRAGILARSVTQLQTVARAITNPGRLEDANTEAKNLKIGMLGGYFMEDIELPVKETAVNFGLEIGARMDIEIANASAARAAAYMLVAYEAAQVHGQRLRAKPDQFDAETRYRLIAASLIQSEWRDEAIRIQQDFTHDFNLLFQDFNFLVAPCVPVVAPLASQLDTVVDGQPPMRASLGKYTQPVSITGCPVISLPLPTPTGLPTAIQIIGPVGSDARLLSYAASLEN